MNRREFIGGAAATLAAGCVSGFPDFAGVRMKMGVLSDIHLYKPGDEDAFVKALEYFREHGADGVLIAGDIAHTGRVEQLKRCADAWYKVFPGDKAPDGRHVEKLFVYGNHDIQCGWMADKKKYEEGSICFEGRYAKVWEETFHEPYSDFWIKNVKGVPVIGGHWNKTDQFEGLGDFLKAHAKELDPSLPFVYTQHAHPKDTCMGPWAWGRDNGASTRALSGYPSAVAFSGHSHYTLTDERSVWQGTFTSINTASLSYLSQDYSLRENFCVNGHGFRGEKRPHRMRDVDTGDGRQGMLVSIWDDHLTIERREFVYGQSLGDDWIVPLPAANEAYSYAKRAARRVTPEFAADAKVSIKVTPKANVKDFTHITLAFPAAEIRGGCRVFEYEVTAVLVEDDVEVVQAQRRMMSPDFHLPVSKLVKEVEFTFAAEDLPLKGHYRFEVRPLECFGRKGGKIESGIVEISEQGGRIEQA